MRLERAYAYDALGQLVARADTLRGSQEFRYDPVGRHPRCTAGQGSHAPRELFAFDPAGNLLDATEAQMQRAQQPQARGSSSSGLGVVGDNRLRFYQDLHFEYDLHGNVTKRTRGNRKAGHHEIIELSWNADHQLVESTTTRHGVTQATRYAYDALGRRVAKSDRFGTTHYLWDGDLMVHSQRGVRESLFIYQPGGFVPLATIQGTAKEPQTYWYHCDQVGAPLELTDVNGQIAWVSDYRVWGEAGLRLAPISATGTNGLQEQRRRGLGPRMDGQGADGSTPSLPAVHLIEQPFRFQGQQFDDETGLNYNRFRYYDPTIGRFVSQDPIGLLGGENIYSYAPNPIVWIDPLGLKCTKEIRASMKKAGMLLKNHAAHHVIPESVWGSLDSACQKELKLDINGAFNAIALPCSEKAKSARGRNIRTPVHDSNHLTYNAAVKSKLTQICGSLSGTSARQEMFRYINQLKNELAGGTSPNINAAGKLR